MKAGNLRFELQKKALPDERGTKGKSTAKGNWQKGGYSKLIPCTTYTINLHNLYHGHQTSQLIPKIDVSKS